MLESLDMDSENHYPKVSNIRKFGYPKIQIFEIQILNFKHHLFQVKGHVKLVLNLIMSNFWLEKFFCELQ